MGTRKATHCCLHFGPLPQRKWRPLAALALALLIAAPGCRTWAGLRPVPAKAVGAQPRYVPSEKNMVSLPPYVIEPPDILLDRCLAGDSQGAV